MIDKYKIQICFILLIIVIATLGTGVAMADTQQPSGSGTDADPYKITNWHELAYMTDDLDASYELQNELNSSTDGYSEHASDTANSGKGWMPIGDSISPFNGTIDGQNYKIDSLKINRSSDNVALFGVITSDGMVHNIRVTNVDINGYKKTGGLIGDNGGNVINAYVSGYINGNSGVGGIAGRTGFSSNTSKSYFNGTVNGIDNVGGLVGNKFAGTIGNSYSTGIVNGSGSAVGGLVGFNDNGDIKNSYSAGTVSGNSSVGGLVGSNGGNVIDSYWDIQSSSQSSTSGSGVGLNTSEMQGIDANSNMSALDFNSIWSTVEAGDGATSDGYPVLQSIDRDAQLTAQDSTDPTSKVTIQTQDTNSNSINTTYQVFDSNSNQIASGETGSDGTVTETLEEGDYDIIVGGDGTYEQKNRNINLNADTTETFTLSKTQSDLTIETTFGGVSQSTINYVIEDVDGNQVASGETDVDGLATETLSNDDYTVKVATQTGIFVEESRSVSLTADTTESFDLQREQYNLSIFISDEEGNSLNTDVELVDVDGNTVLNKSTSSVTKKLKAGAYDIKVADDTNEYNQKTASLTLTNDLTESFTLGESVFTYDASIEDSEGNAIETDYEILSNSGEILSEGTTDKDGNFKAVLDAGSYKISVAESDSIYKSKELNINLNSDASDTIQVEYGVSDIVRVDNKTEDIEPPAETDSLSLFDNDEEVEGFTTNVSVSGDSLSDMVVLDINESLESYDESTEGVLVGERLPQQLEVDGEIAPVYLSEAPTRVDDEIYGVYNSRNSNLVVYGIDSDSSENITVTSVTEDYSIMTRIEEFGVQDLIPFDIPFF